MQNPIYEYSPSVEPDWYHLSANPSDFAMGLLRKSPAKINWYHLSANPSDAAIDLLDKHPDRINPFMLGRNTNPRANMLFDKYELKRSGGSLSPNPADYALDWLEANRSQIDWDFLARNPSPRALELMENNWLGQIRLAQLCSNPSDRAIQLARKYFTVEYMLSVALLLSMNPCDAALDILLNHLDAINWQYFSANPSPRAVAYLVKHPDKINWEVIFTNKSEQVVPLLRDYINRTPKLSDRQWGELCKYHAHHFPEMFATLNYAKMKEQCAPFKAELQRTVFHPDYLMHLATTYQIPFHELLIIHAV